MPLRGRKDFMKKFRIFALFLALLLLLCGCGTTPAVTTDERSHDVSTGDTDPTDTDPAGNNPTHKPGEDFSVCVLADTYVQNASAEKNTADDNFSTATDIQIKSNTGNKQTRYAYVKFDLSELAADKDFGKVSLSLTVSARQKDAANPENMKVNIYGYPATAEMEKLTFHNRPEPYGLITSRDDLTTTGERYSFPVTDYVRQAIARGDRYVVFCLEEATPEVPLHIRFHSLEGDRGQAATLDVSFSEKDTQTYTGGFGEEEELPDGLDVIIGSSEGEKTVTVTVSEDAYVSSGESAAGDTLNKPLGGEKTLDFKAKNGKGEKLWRIVYLKFDVSDIKAEDFVFCNLYLNCINNEISSGATIRVYDCNPQDWDEKTLTFANRPLDGELLTTGSGAKGTVLIDVTEAVKKAITEGADEIAFRLEGDETNPRRLTFSSKEAGEGVAPSLRFTSGKTFFTTELNVTGVNPWGYAMKQVTAWLDRWETIQKTQGATKAETVKKDAGEYSVSVGAATAGNTNGSSTRYTNYPTRTLDTLPSYQYRENETASYDTYGGKTGGKTFPATGFFYTVFDENRWWVVDPLGNPYYHVGVVNISTGSANQKKHLLSKFGTVSDWAQKETEHLRDLGFNSCGGWSDLTNLSKVNDPLSQTKILYTLKTYVQQIGLEVSGSGSTGIVGNVLPVFEPGFVKSVDATAKQVAAYADNRNVFGWMSDNELPDSLTMLDNALMLNVREDSRFAYTYATAWTFLYLKTGKADVSANDVTDELRKEFRAMAYDRYFEVTSAAIRKYDPNHMYLGSRFLRGCYTDPYVMKVAGYWCDIITFNYYNEWTPDFTLMSDIQLWANTPFMVTEWYAKGMDVCTPESRLTNKSGAGWTVRTQEDRGLFYQNFALGLMESKYCVGFDWFKYWDNDPDDQTADSSNRDSNKGIYATDMKEYTALTEVMEKLNTNKYSLIEYFDTRSK